MRLCAALLLVTAGASSARADDVAVGASIGAGAQGSATYGALELRLDQHWDNVKLGLGARGVWDDGTFRRSDWNQIADVVTIVRDFEVAGELEDGGHVALAAGALAPAHVARIADGYRSTLDDRWRTGVRTAAVTKTTEASLEIDDVLDPALIAGAVDYQVAPPWGVHLAVGVDPTQPSSLTTTRIASTIEAGGSYRFESKTARADLGVSLMAELGLGFTAVGYIDAAIVRDDVRYTIRADARGGNGTAGDMFGPLYRIERTAIYTRARAGELQGGSFGATTGIASERGWFDVGMRARPGLGMLATASAGLPMSRRFQAAAWAAASKTDGAGAGELRVIWAKRLFSGLQAARIYQFTDPMAPTAVWSLTAWFGASTD